MKKGMWIGASAATLSLALAGAALAQDATSSLDISAAQAQAIDELNSAALASTAAGTGAVALGIGMLIFWLIFGIGGFALWLWALIDVIRREFKNPSDKTLWLVLVIIIPWVGSIAYLVAGRKNGTLPNAPAKAAPAPAVAPAEEKKAE